MAEEKVKASKKTSVGNEDVGASAEVHAEAGVEVTDSSVSAGAEVGVGVEAHAGTTVGGVDGKQVDPANTFWYKVGGEPNGGRGENCVNTNHMEAGKWNDIACTNTRPFLCQIQTG